MSVKPRKYELVFITDPERTDEQVTAVAESVKEFIEKDGGSVEQIEQWGKKKLAYIVKKQKYGFYTLCLFTALPSSIEELEKFLKYNDNVLKFITLSHNPLSMLKPPATDSTTLYQAEGN